MKELTIEQKAKAYDEALERMKSWVKGEHPECFSEAQKAAEFIFPELKESEDERIRKNCIHFLELQKSHHAATFEIEECIAWLKSLKDRVQAQKQWKPSEEMLEALYKVIPENVIAISEDEMLLGKLYQGLKYGRVLSKN